MAEAEKRSDDERKEVAEIPPFIRSALTDNKLVLLIGAGFSAAAGIPSSPEIANVLAVRLQSSGVSKDEIHGALAKGFDAICDLYIRELSGPRLKEHVAQIIKAAEVKADREPHSLIHKVSPVDVVTTNFDMMLERTAPEPTRFRAIWRGDQLSQRGHHVNAYHIHGHVGDPSSMVLGSFGNRGKDAALNQRVKILFKENVVVGLGTSAQDVNILRFFQENSQGANPEELRHRGILVVGAKPTLPLSQPEVEAAGLKFVRQDAVVFLRTLAREVEELKKAQFAKIEEVVRAVPEGEQILRSIDSPPDVNEVLRTLAQSEIPERGENTAVAEVLEALTSQSFGRRLAFKLDARALVSFIIGRLSRYEAGRGNRRRFRSTLKLHKICYFGGCYQFRTPLDFTFREYPYGVWSSGLEHTIVSMLEEGLLRRTQGERTPAGIREGAQEYELTAKGEGLYAQAAAEVDAHLETWPTDERDQRVKELDAFFEYLYSKDTRTLGSASKADFSRRAWTPWMKRPVVKLVEAALAGSQADTETQDSVLDRVSRGMDKLVQSSGQPLPKPFAGAQGLPAELESRHRGYMFDPRRVNWFPGTLTPSNYFVNVEAYRTDMELLEMAARDLNAKIPAAIRDFVVLQEGIMEDVAPRLVDTRDGARMAGPMFAYPSHETIIDLSSYKGRRAVLLVNTAQTSNSVRRAVNVLASAGVKVNFVAAFADRGCGLAHACHDMKVGFASFLSPEDLMGLVGATYANRIA